MRTANIIAGVFFALMALIHLARSMCPFDVTVDGFHFPYLASQAVFVVSGLLSAWLFRFPKAI
jgi:hypothetical protein